MSASLIGVAGMRRTAQIRFQNLRETEDRIQRRAQLVTGARQEPRLGLTRGLRLARARGQQRAGVLQALGEDAQLVARGGQCLQRLVAGQSLGVRGQALDALDDTAEQHQIGSDAADDDEHAGRDIDPEVATHGLARCRRVLGD